MLTQDPQFCVLCWNSNHGIWKISEYSPETHLGKRAYLGAQSSFSIYQGLHPDIGGFAMRLVLNQEGWKEATLREGLEITRWHEVGTFFECYRSSDPGFSGMQRQHLQLSHLPNYKIHLLNTYCLGDWESCILTVFILHRTLLLLSSFLKKNVFIYLAATGLSCAMWDLVPRPGIEPRPPALGA